MTQKDKDLFAARSVMAMMQNCSTPVLTFDYEKDIVKKALTMYIESVSKEQ